PNVVALESLGHRWEPLENVVGVVLEDVPAAVLSNANPARLLRHAGREDQELVLLERTSLLFGRFRQMQIKVEQHLWLWHMIIPLWRCRHRIPLALSTPLRAGTRGTASARRRPVHRRCAL